MKQKGIRIYNKYKLNKTYIMEQPKGRTRMSETEKSIIREYRSKGYSLEQIARFVGRSSTSVKRVVYGW